MTTTVENIQSTETLNAAFATLTNVVLCVLLVPRFGIAGAAFATATAFFLLNVLRIWEARYMVRLRTFRPYLLRVVAVSAGAALLSFSILRWSGTLQGADAVSILARIVIVGVLQVAAMWSIGLNAKDKDMLVTLATSLSKRRAPMGGPM